VVQGEYFVDTDPGFGAGTALTIAPGMDISSLMFSLDLGPVNPGAHQLFVRFKDSRGNWGQTNVRAFYNDGLQTSDTSRAALLAGEYFIDNDPGFGKGTVIPVEASSTEDEVSFSVDISTLTAGFHRISTRFQDIRGSWGLSSSRMFYKEVFPSGIETAKIVRGEYFIGGDPGFGNGTALSFTSSSDLSNIMFSLDIDTVSAGFHFFSTRFQNAKGKWGLTNNRAFYKQRIEQSATLPDVATLEYYIDTDPGFGSGKKLVISPTTDLNDFLFEIDIESVELGDHMLHVRAQDSNGHWSLTNVSSFRLEPQSGLYVTIGQVEQDLCMGSKVQIPFKSSGPFSEGNVFTAQLSDQFGSFASPYTIGSLTGTDSDTIIATVPNIAPGSSYRVRIISTDPEKTSVSNGVPLSIHGIPPVFTITGDSIVCFGNSEYALSNFANEKDKYVWSLSGGGALTAKGDKASVVWATEGNFTLKVTYTGLCAADDSVKTLDVRAVNSPLTGTFQNLLPSNGEANLSLPVSFSWSPIAQASSYDIYIWPENQTKPNAPTVADITAINYTLDNPVVISDEASYNWQVVAKMACYELAGPLQTFNTRQLPDLIVESISAPSTAISETEISVNWRTKNQGTGGTGNGSWVDIVYLSDQPILSNALETHIISVSSNFSALAVGQSYTSGTYNFRLPQGMQGNYYVIVQTNYYGNFKEKLTTNNLLTSSPIAVTLAPHADLVVKAVTVAPLSAFSEDEITVTYTIANEGAGPANASWWRDQISIGTSETPNPAADLILAHKNRDASLAVNGNYSVTTKVRLPQRINGTYYIHVAADIGNQVFEYIREENNALNSLAMNIIQRPTANLVVSNMKATPASAANGQSVIVSWNTNNEGATETAHQWSESVFLSKDQTFDPGSDALIHTILRTEPIPSLGNSSTQQNFALPQNLTEGDYYYFVVTDWQNGIYENPGEDDNVSAAFGKVTIKIPDIKPLTLAAPTNALSGQTIDVQWTAKDDSEAGVHNNIWTDGIYLSTDQNFDPGTDKLLASVTNSQFVPKGGEYAKSLQVVIPPGTSGNHYLILVVDQSGAISEKDEDNNTYSAPITLTLAPWPDMAVTQIDVPGTDTLGTVLRLAYNFTNEGAGALETTNWTDGVYLSPVDTLDESRLILLGAFAQSRPVAVGEIISQQASFVLPGTLPAGSYFVVVRLDQRNAVFENGARANNTMVSTQAITLVSSPAVDLSVIGGKILSVNVTAGQAVDLEWTVRNNSAASTEIPSWTDAIYLSDDAFFDNTDALLSSQPVTEILASGASYKKLLTVTLPQEIEGDVYFLIMADSYRQHNDVDRGNNIIPLTSASGNPIFPIQLPPPADLVPKTFSAPATSLVGQSVLVSFTVKNDGTGPTPASYWADQLFLSNDTQLGNDISLNFFDRTAVLESAQEYTIEGSVALPANISGNYILLLKTDAGNQVFERGKENNNITYKAILIGSPAPADLTVTDIVMPSAAQLAGSNMTIRWTLNNLGSNAVSGSIREAVYISADEQLDASDVLFGTLEGMIDIVALSNAERTLQIPLANLAVGSYFVIVKTDILNSVTEQNEDNNQTISSSKLTIDIQELVLNTTAAAEISANAPLYYRLEIPDNLVNETLSITLTSKGVADAVNRLFFRKGEIPNVNKPDFAAAVPFQADQELIVPALTQGTYYLMALGTGGQPVELLARIIPFGITAVESDKGGNTGQVTVKIIGAKFEPGMTVTLTGPGNHTASRVHFSDPSKMFATFGLNGAALGKYTVQIRKQDGSLASLAEGFEVINGTPGGVNGALGLFACQIQNIGFDENIAVNVIHPASVRRNQKVKLTVAYSNAGNVDIPAQTRLLLSLEGAPINFSSDFSVQPSELELHFVESDGPPDILRAGSTGFINFYVYATAPISLIITQ
jgi:subtilase family serine protease